MEDYETLEDYVRDLLESCEDVHKVHSRFNYLVEVIQTCYEEALEKFKEEEK